MVDAGIKKGGAGGGLPPHESDETETWLMLEEKKGGLGGSPPHESDETETWLLLKEKKFKKFQKKGGCPGWPRWGLPLSGALIPSLPFLTPPLSRSSATLSLSLFHFSNPSLLMRALFFEQKKRFSRVRGRSEDLAHDTQARADSKQQQQYGSRREKGARRSGGNAVEPHVEETWRGGAAR